MKFRDKDAPRSKDGAFKSVGLLLIDLINPMDFDAAEKLLPKLEGVVDVAVRLREEADELGIPTIYVNDNYGGMALGALEDRRDLLESRGD